jgi:hypothetical protein
MRTFFAAVVERSAEWAGDVTTEPYEVGWAGEAIAFVRVLEVSGTPGQLCLRPQISPDGMHWCDEGQEFEPITTAGVNFLRVEKFGNWLRLAGETSPGAVFKVLVSWALKE